MKDHRYKQLKNGMIMSIAVEIALIGGLTTLCVMDGFKPALCFAIVMSSSVAVLIPNLFLWDALKGRRHNRPQLTIETFTPPVKLGCDLASVFMKIDRLNANREWSPILDSDDDTPAALHVVIQPRQGALRQ